MLLASDITATFHPSTIQGSRSLGVGQLNVCGIVINFTVYEITRKPIILWVKLLWLDTPMRKLVMPKSPNTLYLVEKYK